MKRIVLIACVSKKGQQKAKAKDLYESTLFKSSLAYAQALNPDKIFILSALHHLLDLDTEIAPYNVTMSNVPKDKRKSELKILNPEEKKEWGKKVIQQLSNEADLQNDNFIILAGKEYIKPIVNSIVHLDNPLIGLGQGKRLQFLTQQAPLGNITKELHKLFNKQRRFTFPFKQFSKEIPNNGIYIIFEIGEKFENLDRIVRVGTHTGNNQLRSRLNQHFVKENKNRSIFRKNIGRCILNKESSSYLNLWELDTTAKDEKEKNIKLIDRVFENKIEKQISTYIQTNFSFCVFQVNSKVDRLFWESKIVSTLAKESAIKPSANWLGNFSTKDKIKISGLWQVNELYNDSLTKLEFDTLKKKVSRNGDTEETLKNYE
jgi:hypothetical protein